ncbi:MAG TPA: OmpA family protein [Chitinispirillaceae bacterium]|nr:OmpA family protein [Chitinispirillaceae bacterium]
MRLSKVLLSGAVMLSFAITVAANDVNTSGQSGVVRTFSANTMGKTGFHIGSSFKYAADKEYLTIVKKGNEKISHDASHLFSGNFYIGVALGKYLDLSMDIPAYSDISGFDQNLSGIGDLGVLLKLGNPFQKENAFISHAYCLKLTFPTGQDKRGLFARHSYYITDNANSLTSELAENAYFVNPMMLWTMNFDRLPAAIPLRLHANLGCVVAPQKSRSAVVGAMAIEYTPAPVITLFTEITGESSVNRYTEKFDVYSFNDDQVWLTPGIKFNFTNGMYLTIAGDFGISDKSDANVTSWKYGRYSYTTKALPRFGTQVALGWQGILKEQDADKDGIIDKLDKCPKEAEDKDGFADDDGCPDNDNDNDGIPDTRDKCPLQAVTCDGCPILDTDKDGINDDIDKCPNEPEDKDGFQDEDGCIDRDNDVDGVDDEKDLCPEKAEDLDGFEDNDGCPELDNDGDGVPDSLDKCLGVKGLPSNDGCPKTQEIQRGKLVLAGVTFMSGKAILNVNSYTILDQVYESLSEWKEVKLEIQGHTDSQGSDVANLKLSQARADAVRMYLINKGISTDRLRAVGYGETFPVSDNATAEGRERNRRVEMHRID